ncbi:hypothetical protein AB0J57_01980 [Streptomyces sp. NPDC049837]|uniref:hypothetical protein n=1 Tax=Streptomyces sp. NPDC049837 TaxID=3155277 RepID=UPI0034480E9F
MGDNPATFSWWGLTWPAVPEMGLPPELKYADVQVVFNHRSIHLEGPPAADHTVFVHVRYSTRARAQWLAAQAGLRVIGDSQHGW